jgi:tRNA-(ms[2]io[6]A)-hydroxylase
LVDTLVVGALIEARSCERFATLVPHLDGELGEFYASLLKSESRHFQDYLKLAADQADEAELEARLQVFRAREQELIESADSEMRFHSGVPRH